MTTRTLYDISADLAALDEILSEVGGDVTDAEAEAAIEAWFQETAGDLRTKADAYCRLIREIEARGEARKAEADRILRLASTDSNAAGRLKTRLKDVLESHGIKKLETPMFRLSIATNGGRQALIYDAAEVEFPSEFQKVIIKGDDEAIRSAIEDGFELPFAHLAPRGSHLRIK